VLLLEAGGAKTDEDALVLADRFSNFMTYPQYNWGYQSAPQKHLNARQVDYSRGRGLGGSSRINFACYTIGPKGDFDHWAEIVGDDFFNWSNARRRYNSIENYDLNVSSKYKNYADFTKAEHGRDGPLKVGMPVQLERGMPELIDAAIEKGMTYNTDINSGNPIGIGICASTAQKGRRTTSALAYLEDRPANLTIVTDSVASKVLFEGKRAIGVLAGGRRCQSSSSRSM